MTTYLMALLIFTSGGEFIQRPSEPKIAEGFYFDEKGDVRMKNPTSEDCYFYRQDSVTFRVFCRQDKVTTQEEPKSWESARVQTIPIE